MNISINKNSMPEQLYFIKEKAVSTHIYFGCTSNLSAVINQFISNRPHFDNKSHEIWTCTLKNSEYSCYDFHYIITEMSKKYSFPFKKVEDTEYFIHDTDFTEFTKLLDKLSVGYNFEKIDVNELRNKARSYNYTKIREERNYDDNKYEVLLTKNLDAFVSNYKFC
jgi:hypothetical protein